MLILAIKFWYLRNVTTKIAILFLPQIKVEAAFENASKSTHNPKQ